MGLSGDHDAAAGIERTSPRKFSPVNTIRDVDAYHLTDRRTVRGSRRFGQGLDFVHQVSGNRWGWLYLGGARGGCYHRGDGLGIGQRADHRPDGAVATYGQDPPRQVAPGGVVFHADRGIPFASTQLHEVAVELDGLQLIAARACAGVKRWPSYSGRRGNRIP